jgi:hypothetical protein
MTNVNTGWGSVSFQPLGGIDAQTTASFSNLGLSLAGPYYETTAVTFNVTTWNTSPSATDTTILLHELGHVINLLAAGLGAQNGIANDGSGSNPGTSLNNSIAVNNDCITKVSFP